MGFTAKFLLVLTILLSTPGHLEAKTSKPILHGKNWVAITGKPLAATAGAQIFQQGGNAVDAACAMLAVTSTMFDVLSWGGETQALIYNPHTSEVIAINALGVAPSGATPEYFNNLGMDVPPHYGPLAAVTPGTPGGLMVMLAEYGSLSLAQVLKPAMEMAQGYPMEKQTADSIESHKEEIRQWPYSEQLFLTHPGEQREAPHPGEIFRQPDLYRMLEKLTEAEASALAQGKSRKQAIYAAYARFYKGDIGAEFVRSSAEMGGLHTLEDLADWKVHIEQPLKTTYKGIEVYKLTSWVQGPVMLQQLNMLEELDVKSMGYNSARYIHTLYQVMNLAYADRDFYYGDPYFAPEEPISGLLSKQYAHDRLKLLDPHRNDPLLKPGDPYPYQNGKNPFLDLLDAWSSDHRHNGELAPSWQKASIDQTVFERDFLAGTTSVQAADAEGWVVSMTPSGGWIPAVIAGKTGIGMSQRMQSFVLDKKDNPYNVLEPGKRPRATLTPGLALKNGKPWLSFAVQGGDIQDQVLTQFFLNMVEFGMDVQTAVEAPNFWSYQMRNSFGEHESQPGRLLLNNSIPEWVQSELKGMGYKLVFRQRTSGPITAIFFDQENNAFQGGASDFGDDYGIAW